MESKSRVEVEEKAMGEAHSTVGFGLPTSTKYHFAPPAEADIKFLVEHMREGDRRELKRWLGTDIEWAVRHSVAMSDVCHAGFFADGSLACIFGATRLNIMEADAILWELSTTEVDRHKVEFVRAAREGLNMVFRAMPDVAEFGNWVDLDYTGAVRWIERLGGDFALNQTRPGPFGGKFANFYIMNPYFNYNKED
jgi:hypothetical protein